MTKPEPKWFSPERIIAIPGGSPDFPMCAVSVFVNECNNVQCEDRCRKIVLNINTPIMGFRLDFDLETGERLLGELDACHWRAKEEINAD